MTQSPSASPKPVSLALAKRAARVAAVAKVQHAAEANQLIQLVRSRSDDVAGAFWDIGAELAKLTDPRLYKALGYTSFDALCEAKLGFPITTARKLIAIASALPRGDAIRLRQERSAALLDLAGARGVKPVALLHGKIRVPGAHQPVLVSDLSANALKRIARDERHAHAKGKSAMAQKTREGDALAKRIAKALAGVAGVEVRSSMPRRKDAAALLHITVPMLEIEKLARALRGVRAD